MLILSAFFYFKCILELDTGLSAGIIATSQQDYLRRLQMD